MSDEVRDQLREKIQQIIKDEVQEGINDYIDSGNAEGFGKDDKLNVRISNDEVDKIIKQYKKEKKRRRSNLFQAKNLGLVDKNGNPLDAK
tara:strand:- start:1032 stop:1301 length:270 start_codon:yes stop_codon:yes gene_type:complete